MNTKLLVLGVLVLAIVVPMASCSFADASSGVSLKVNQFYTDIAGYGHVVVTVTNNTSRPISDVWVHLTYLNSSGEPVGADDWVIVASFMGETISPYESYTDEFIVVKDVNKRASRVRAKITSFDYA
jgi:hypothetical protein